MDVGALLLCGVPLFVSLGLFAAAKLWSWRQHRARMETYRAACRELGLRQTPEFWEGSFDGRWIGSSWTHQRLATSRRRLHAFTRSASRPLESLGIGLYAFAGASETMHGVQPSVESWRSELPPSVVLEPDPYGGELRVHARNAAAARSRLTRPSVIAELRLALAQCEYLRIGDAQIELLHAPYESSSQALGAKLQLAARIAYALE